MSFIWFVAGMLVASAFNGIERRQVERTGERPDYYGVLEREGTPPARTPKSEETGGWIE